MLRLAASVCLLAVLTFIGLAGDRLPCVDNLVRLFVANQADFVSREEMMRLLSPDGALAVVLTACVDVPAGESKFEGELEVFLREPSRWGVPIPSDGHGCYDE